MVYNLEVKSMADLDGIAHPPPESYAALVIRDLCDSGLVERVRLQSFDDRIVASARHLMPGLCCGLLVEERSGLDAFPVRPGFVPDYVNPHFSIVDRNLIEWLHGLGAKVVVWTVNAPDDMIRMKRLGVDGLITDHPDVAMNLHELALE